MKNKAPKIEAVDKETVINSLQQVEDTRPSNSFRLILNKFIESPNEAIKLTFSTKKRANPIALNLRILSTHEKCGVAITVIQRRNEIFLIKENEEQIHKEMIDQGLFIGYRRKYIGRGKGKNPGTRAGSSKISLKHFAEAIKSFKNGE